MTVPPLAPKRGRTLAPCTLASAIMCAVAWGAFPLLSRRLQVSPILLYWLLLCLGLAAQGGLLVWLVRRETGGLDWVRFRQAVGLSCPRDARTGLARPRLFGWLALWLIPGFLVSLLAVALGVVGGVIFAYTVGPRATTYYPLDLASPGLAGSRWAAMGLLTVWLVLSVFVEELFFRGFLVVPGKFRKRDWLAQAALYAGYHLFQPWVIPARFLQALLWQWPVRRWRSVWMSILLRGLPNLVFLAVVLATFTWPAFRELPAKLELPYVSRQPAPEKVWPRAPLAAAPHYDPQAHNFFQVDLRSRDVSKLDLKHAFADLDHASFDRYTRWPPRERLPANFDPSQVMALGKNPGLGLRALHAQGLTGRGVGIGIVDHCLLVNHREYARRVRWYEEMGLPQSAQMHAPAVASLALGETVGVAPEANLFHIGFADDPRPILLTFHTFALGIRRLLEINQRLPAPEKIRVISLSISLMPGLPGYAECARAIEAALAQNVAVIMVKDESSYPVAGLFQIFGLARPCLADPDLPNSYVPMFWVRNGRNGPWHFPNLIFVPMESRTMAAPTGPEDYTHDGQGGMSWTVPYVAGLYALAAQANPQITPDGFRAALFRTGRSIPYRHKGSEVSVGPVVDPQALIQAVRAEK
jgi:membrane protease YdiL (CAAX protease family)